MFAIKLIHLIEEIYFFLKKRYLKLKRWEEKYLWLLLDQKEKKNDELLLYITT